MKWLDIPYTTSLSRILWFRMLVFLTFHIKFKCLFIFNQLQQLLKCACAKITETNTEPRTEILKNQESLLLGTRHFLIYDKWPPSLSFDRVKTFYGDPLKTFFSLSIIYTILQINTTTDLNTLFCWYLKKMIHAQNMMPLVHSRIKF